MAERTLTLPQLFRDRVARFGDRVARRRKREGAWVASSWNEWSRSVAELARGLMATRVQPGDAVAILSQTRAEWVECDLAILSAGAISVPIYPSSLPDQIEYILNNASVVAIFCENEDQLGKVSAVRWRCPRLREVVLMEGSSAGAKTLDDLRRAGLAVAADDLRARTDAARPEETATIVYTSGTTGPPKGVVQTHANHFAAASSVASLGMLTEADEDLFFLPLAHSFARFEEFLQLYVGFTTSYAESLEKLVPNLAETRPTFLCAVPRIYEKIYEKLMGGGGSPLARRAVGFAAATGRDVSRLRQRRERVPIGLAARLLLADASVFRKVRALFGGRIRICVTGAAPIAREILEFFHAAGIQILEGYGLTETCPALTLNTLEQYRFGTVGRKIPGVELKIAEDGEILGRGPNVAQGYFNRPEETRASFLEGGWFATGDIGQVDADGFLKITDRKKDLIKTSGGKYVAPQEVERALKADPLIAQALVHGDRRKFCSAILVLNREAVEAWAHANGIAVNGYATLLLDLKLVEHVRARVEEANKKLATYEQVKKFLIAPKEWTPEGGELTPTLKVKRKVVTALFEKELDALYEEKYG